MTASRTRSRKMARCWSVAGVLLMLALAFSSTYTAVAAPPGNEHFQRTWERTDMPVLDGEVSRTWMWGPEANYPIMQEPYAESPGGMREVQYYDKARMEITHPSEDANSIWYVTNGLLVVELITGQMQTGDATFEPKSPALVNVAGDFDDPTGPQYATFGTLLDATPRALGSTIIQRVDRAGAVTDDPSLAGQGVTVAHLDEVTNHAIATPFWDFMNSSGPVYEGGQYTDAKLFENPYFATGRPITEAYWANVKVAGTYKGVLMQCFERRCLTNTPGNSDGFIVEAGNVGQHYYAWRYGDNGGTPQTPDDTPDVPNSEPATEYDFLRKWGLPDKGIAMDSPYMIAAGPNGEYYVTNAAGNQVLKFDANGILLTAWGSTGSGNGQFKVPVGIDVDENGNVYVADFGNHRIQKFDPNGAFIATWGTNGTDQGQFNYPYGLAIGADDIVYVTDLNNHRVQRFTLDGTFGGMWGGLGSGVGQFSTPHGIATTPGGLIYVADTGNGRVQIFDGAGNPQGLIGGPGDADGQFSLPLGVTVAGNGTVYVSDIGHDTIQIFDVLPVVAPANARTLAVVQYLFAGELGEPGAFNNPIGMDIDGYGRLLIADTGNNRVQIYGQSGFILGGPSKLVDVWTDDSRGRFSSGNPDGVAVAADGRVYAVDNGQNLIKVFSNDGAYLDQYGPQLSGNVTLQTPLDLALDSQGNVYVTDYDLDTVIKLDPDGNFIAQFGGTGTANGQFDAPSGIALDADDNIYVVDSLNKRVQKFAPNFSFLASWTGTGTETFDSPIGIAIHGERLYVTDSGNADKVRGFDLVGNFLGEWSGFDQPTGIATDADGYVYVGDKASLIQKFSPDGEFIAKFGRLGTGDGELTLDTTGPRLDLDADGNVYVGDSGNQRIQVFEPVS